MLCLPPLKQGERIIWPLGGFQVRHFSLILLAIPRPLEMTGLWKNEGGLLLPQLVWD